MPVSGKLKALISWSKSWKNVFELLMLLATAAMAIYTASMARETKNLAQLELKPYITPLDVNLQMVDNTQTPVKEVTYLSGAVPVGTVENIERYTLTIKFSNPSKLPSMIRVRKIVGNFGPVDKWNNYSFLVPAHGTTGWLFGVTFLSRDLVTADSIHIDYDLENFSPTMGITKPLKFSAVCTLPNSNCFLLPFEAELPSGYYK